MSTHYTRPDAGAARAPFPIVSRDVTRYRSAAEICAAINAAAADAPEFSDACYAPGAADWHGPTRGASFAHFLYLIDGARGSYSVSNTRENLLTLARKVNTIRAAFDGKPRRAPAAKRAPTSAPHVAARALLTDGNARDAIQLAENSGAVFFGAAAIGAPGVPYMGCETVEFFGQSFTIGRAIKTGRFLVLHTSTALSVSGSAHRDGFKTHSAAVDWIETESACDAWREKFLTALHGRSAFDQTAARARYFEDETAPVDTIEPAPVESDPAETAPDAPIEQPAPVEAWPPLQPMMRPADHIARLPLFARLAIERIDADSDLRTGAKLDELLRAYAAQYRETCDDYTRQSAHAIASRRFWNFRPDDAPIAPAAIVPAADPAPVCEPVESIQTAPDDIAQPEPAAVESAPDAPMDPAAVDRAPDPAPAARALPLLPVLVSNALERIESGESLLSAAAWEWASANHYTRAFVDDWLIDQNHSVRHLIGSPEARFRALVDMVHSDADPAAVYGWKRAPVDTAPAAPEPAAAPVDPAPRADAAPVDTGAAPGGWMRPAAGMLSESEARAWPSAEPVESAPTPGYAFPAEALPATHSDAAPVDVDTMRAQLCAVEDAILAAAPRKFSNGQYGGDIEAAARSRSVPAELKRRRKTLRAMISAARDAAADAAPVPVPVPGKFETFSGMSDLDLRRYIEGCHIARQFGIDFEHAAQELNDRKERGTWSNPGAPVATHSAPHPVPADTAPDDDTTPAPLDGLDVIETADAETLAEFDRLSRAPGVSQPATDARPIPSGPVLRIPAGDLRARIPARFAPAYLLTA